MERPVLWTLPSLERNKDATKSSATLTIARGPKQKAYDPVTLYLQSECEYNGNYSPSKKGGTGAITSVSLYNQDDPEEKIQFTETCTEVQWAGDLEYDGRFLINAKSNHKLLITVFNPKFLDTKLADMAHLENVQLQYRKVSDSLEKWEDADIDFKTKPEDDYGYITVTWKFDSSSSNDGVYEVRLTSLCNQALNKVPAKIKKFHSESLFGRID